MDDLLALVRPELRGIAAYHVPRPEGVRAKLDANEQPQILPAEIRAALGEHLATVELNRYPDPGCDELRALLARELEVGTDELVFGNGSDEIIEIALATFAMPRPGRERATVLYPTPTFSVFRIAAHALGVEPVEVPLGPRFELDAAAVDRAVAEARPNLVFFARPNNPTGTLWPGAAVLELCRAHPDVLFVSDEAYGDYGGESLLPARALHPNLLVMRTLSKIGLAGLRTGFLVAPAALAAEMEKVRPPYNVSSLNQAAALYLLSNHRDWFRARCAEVAAERDRVAAALGDLAGLEVFDSAANLILFRVGAPGAGGGERSWQALADDGVLVRSFGGEGALADCLRVTIGTPDENDLFLAAIARALA